MTKIIKLPNLIEKTNNLTERNRENITTILKGIDEGGFDKLTKGFSSEKEQNKVVLSGFLNSTNVSLAKLGDIKIDINHIKNYIRNKPDIPKDLECKIAKLYLKKLYESGATNISFIARIKDVFNIENKADIENKNIDFKTIQINIGKQSDNWIDNINSITVSNDEIFDVLGNDIKKYANFQSQNVSSQQIILDLLNFEIKGVINHVKSWGEKASKDMEDFISPMNDISDIFNEAVDSEILQLNLKKAGIEDILILGEKEITTREKTYWKEYIKRLEKQGLPEDYIRKLKDLLLGKIEYQTLKNNLKKRIEIINRQIWKKYIENFEKIGKNPEIVAILKKLYSSNFDFSKLDQTEQTLLRQCLVIDKFDKKENSFAKYSGLDQEEFKSFLKDLYDFEKDETTIDINNVGSLKLHITKEVQGGENQTFMDIEKFKNMDLINPVKFTVNIDDNDENLIKDLEETQDSPLRAGGIMETHTVKGGKLNIGNGYTLEICGKEITKSQLDELLNYSYFTNDKLDEKIKAFDDLNGKLRDLGLYDEIKDLVDPIKNKILSNQDYFSDNGRAQNNDQGCGQFCIFEEVLKKLDVKVIKRDLIFEGKNIDRLNQIYIISKLGGSQGKEGQEKTQKIAEQQDKKVHQIFDAARCSDEELSDAEGGKAEAEALRSSIKWAYDGYKESGEDDDGNQEFSFDYEIEEEAEKYRSQLDEEGKKAFKEELNKLCDEDPDIEDDRENIKSEIDNLIYGLEHPSTNNDTYDDGEEIPNQQEKSEADRINEFREGLKGDKECLPFSVGTVLYFDLGESQLPPKDITDAEKSFYAFEIVASNDENFTMRAIGGDLKSSLAGKECVIPKAPEQLDELKKSGSIFKVKKSETRDRDSCLKNICSAKFFNDEGKLTAFGDMEGQVRFDGKNFVKTVETENGGKKEVEVKYFSRVGDGTFDDSDSDPTKWGQGKKIYNYEIKKINTSKGTVQLASRFDGYDENYNDIVYEYENEIPFEQFILLMEGKRLKGYSQEEQEAMETKTKINDPKRLALKGKRVKWFSIGSIVNVFKNTTKAIKAKIDERNKEGEADYENWLLSDEGFNLYGKLGPLLGDTAKKLQYEFYTNRENRTRKKIEERYKIFETDPQYSEFFSEHLLGILNREGDVREDKDRYKFAAAFLIMVKNEGPYPRAFANQKDKGKWVYNLLGKEHKDRFLDFYKAKKQEVQQAKDLGYPSTDRLEKQEELNKMEINYIISVIDGRAPYGVNSNEYMSKSIWSKNFMSKLEENIKGYYNNHDSEKEKLETFFSAEESYLRNLGSGKFQKALPALERMCETAKTPGEAFSVKGYLLGAMLMGIIKNNASTKTIKSFWGTCRAMGFTPGYWMRDIEQQDKIKILLDGVTNGEFSKDPNLKYDIFKFEPGNIKDGKYSFGKIFQGYWNSHGEKILQKIENPTYKNKDIEGDKSIFDLANDENNPNNYVFKDIISNSTTNEIDDLNSKVQPIFAQKSPLSATSNMVNAYIPEGGDYKLKSEEEEFKAKDFWNSAAKAIPKGRESKTVVDFIFKKYFNWFYRKYDSMDTTRVVRSLELIKAEKRAGRNNNARYMLWYMLEGHMHEKTRGSFKTEFGSVMRSFLNFFFNNVDQIDSNTIKSTFDEDRIDEFENPYVMLDWKQFRNYNMQTVNGGKNKNKYDKLVRAQLLQRRKEKTDAINYEISDIRSKIRRYGEPDVLPDNIGGITVDMNKSDKVAEDEINKYLYGKAA